MYWSLDFSLLNQSTVTIDSLYTLLHPRILGVSITPAIGVGTGRIHVKCCDESSERHNGSSADDRSGEQLTASGGLTNQSGAHPTASGKYKKLCNHPNHWDEITTGSGILRSV